MRDMTDAVSKICERDWIVFSYLPKKLHICPNVTKMGSIIGHRIDYNGVGALRGPRHISRQNNPNTHPPPPPGYQLIASRVALIFTDIITEFTPCIFVYGLF